MTDVNGGTLVVTADGFVTYSSSGGCNKQRINTKIINSQIMKNIHRDSGVM